MYNLLRASDSRAIIGGQVGCFMFRLFCGSLLVVALGVGASQGQTPTNASPTQPTTPPNNFPIPRDNTPIAANAPHMSRQTRLQIIRDFETQLVYSRTQFPMGTKGLKLKSGVISPSGQELQQLIALWGPSIKPGDPAHISYVRIKDNYIHFDLNGGAVHRKKWYQHIEVSGGSGAS